MGPKDFVAEVYRRMNRVNKPPEGEPKLQTVDEYYGALPYLWAHVNLNYRHRMPTDPDAAILDIGCGPGHFLAACLKWGYRNLSAMDYEMDTDQFRKWGVRECYRVSNDLPTSLRNLQGRFDFIHAAHLIEHIPKHDLLENVDSMFYALRPGGLLVMETPNMLSPPAMAALFITLGHEYGFSQHNLCSLLNICGFQQERAEPVRLPVMSLKARIGDFLRETVLLLSSMKYRLFGWTGTVLSQNIIVSAVRPDSDPLPERLAGPHAQ
jgi:2-polyprenyl-3-methyl-5-hydroxy-6-metoxy-1,4-benzoquinol methylase